MSSRQINDFFFYKKQTKTIEQVDRPGRSLKRGRSLPITQVVPQEFMTPAASAVATQRLRHPVA